VTFFSFTIRLHDQAQYRDIVPSVETLRRSWFTGPAYGTPRELFLYVKVYPYYPVRACAARGKAIGFIRLFVRLSKQKSPHLGI
jgi:hypothetical protein